MLMAAMLRRAFGSDTEAVESVVVYSHAQGVQDNSPGNLQNVRSGLQYEREQVCLSTADKQHCPLPSERIRTGMGRDKARMRVRGANEFVRDVNEAMDLDTFARAYFQSLFKHYSSVRFIGPMAQLCLHDQILEGYRHSLPFCLSSCALLGGHNRWIGQECSAYFLHQRNIAAFFLIRTDCGPFGETWSNGPEGET